MELYEARVNVTIAGCNGDLVDPIAVDTTDIEVRRMVTEALQSGAVLGIPTQENPDLSNYMIDRFAPSDTRAYHLIQVRPKTAFGQM